MLFVHVLLLLVLQSSYTFRQQLHSKTRQASASRVGMSTESIQRAVLWDVDGTLSDSYMLGYTSTQQVLKNNGKAVISEEEYHEGTKFTTPRRLAWHTTGNPDDPSGIELGRQFDDLYVNLVSIDNTRFYDGMQEMLKNLCAKHAGIEYGALSNACGGYVRAVLRSNQVESMFEVGLGADEVPAAKPQPDGLLQLCRMMELDPRNCIYVGDSPTDGQAARAAGMESVGVTWGSHSVEKVMRNFDYVAHNVKELENILCNALDKLQTNV